MTFVAPSGFAGPKLPCIAPSYQARNVKAIPPTSGMVVYRKGQT